MRILHLIHTVDPEAGGPIEYARVAAEQHAQAGHDSGFVTLDDPHSTFLTDFPFSVHAAGPTRNAWADHRAFAAKLVEVAGDYDVAVIHGLWNPATIAGHQVLRRAGLPWVIFTHGMLDPYFRKIKPIKHLVKQIYWTLFQGRVLSQAKAVLFTCQEEQRLAMGAFPGHQDYKAKVVAFCASDLTLPADDMAQGEAAFRQAVPDLGARDYLLFLSRIHPKKACDNLIRAFAAIASEHPELDLVFAGPDQVGWQTELTTLAEGLGVGARVHWAGMIRGATKSAAFAGARAFTLPSHQENFGIVVAEALSLNTPVLVSDKVNIWREIVKDGAGLAAPDTVADTTAMLAQFLTQSVPEQTAMRAATRACYDRHFSVQAAADALLSALDAARDPERSGP